MVSAKGLRRRSFASPGPDPIYWLDLFYDLVFVAILTAASDQFTPNEDPSRTLWLGTTLFLLATIWLTTIFALRRHHEKRSFGLPTRSRRWQMRQIALVVIQMIALITAVLNITQASSNQPTGGFVALGIALLAAAVLYLGGQPKGVPRDRSSLAAAAFLGLAALISFAAAIFMTTPQLIYLLGVFAAVFGSASATVLDKTRTLDSEHLKERFGLLNLIAMGSVFIALSMGLEQTDDPANQALFYVSLLLPIGAFIMYFGPAAPIGEGRPSAKIWIPVEILVAIVILDSGGALGRRAVEPGLADAASGRVSVTTQLGTIFLLFAILCLVGRRVPPYVTIVYFGAALLVYIATVVANIVQTPPSEVIIGETVFFAVVAVAVAVAAGRLWSREPGPLMRETDSL